MNDELNVAVDNAGVARELERVFAADLTVSTRATYESWTRRGFKARLSKWLAAPCGDARGRERGSERRPGGRYSTRISVFAESFVFVAGTRATTA